MTAALRLRARSLGRDTYEPLPAGGLAWQVIQTAGAGTLEDPAVFTVTLTNTGAALWQGVVLAELVFPCRDPRFFLPGFLYGRNRGEAPLRVDTLFPRLRRRRAQGLGCAGRRCDRPAERGQKQRRRIPVHPVRRDRRRAGI
ncbi:MAG TPA: hypothetical protein H9945_10670 [Candidatus Gemmiger avicola]|uniref:Uncharacterized protein n=1 Tax=Candidatus Gemmiger avicola TaxID=2838605 RepID=A0A9D2M918_9FIRM|nr:hypothetical protein [Candidatus Gemmiger avicola]